MKILGRENYKSSINDLEKLNERLLKKIPENLNKSENF